MHVLEARNLSEVVVPRQQHHVVVAPRNRQPRPVGRPRAAVVRVPVGASHAGGKLAQVVAHFARRDVPHQHSAVLVARNKQLALP